MKGFNEIKWSVKEAEEFIEHVRKNEITKQDEVIIKQLLYWYHSNWWLKYLFKVFDFLRKIDKVLGLKGKYKWLTGPIYKE